MWSAGNQKSAGSGHRWGGSGGFTLLELMAVVVVVGLVAAMAMPSISTGLQRWRLRTAVLEMNTMLKFTRTQAVARRQAFQLVLDRSRNVYWLDRPNAAMDAEQAEGLGRRLIALPAGVRFGSVRIGDREAASDRLTMMFFPYGTNTGGVVQVVDDRGQGYQIALDQVTGRTTIRRVLANG